MSASLIELMVLAVLSAFLCDTAAILGHVAATVIFAVLASTIAVVAVGLWAFW